MERIVCLVIGYIFGLFQTGYIVGRLNGIDIRQHGSNNAGTTNTLRTLGAGAGAMCLLGDALKCLLAVTLCRFIFKDTCADRMTLIALYAAFGAMLGHNFPFYLKFKGGKGIACTAGLVISFGLVPTIIGIIIFFSIFFITHYVSLGSIILYASIMVLSVVAGQLGYMNMTGAYLYEAYGVIFLMMIMAFWQHRENIKRLISHTERKTYIKKKADIEKEGN
ncbi:MAG: glycerol-3-phosphate 1-O-acyltransferase PlsY [Lachnospiraceae bacterium]|nr:glycerol-3-phosphate 1-O-acyltransferase PlsY [Lachnospiraceae bacterium]